MTSHQSLELFTLVCVQPIMARLPKAKQVSMKRIIGIQHFLEMFVGEVRIIGVDFLGS